MMDFMAFASQLRTEATIKRTDLSNSDMLEAIARSIEYGVEVMEFKEAKEKEAKENIGSSKRKSHSIQMGDLKDAKDLMQEIEEVAAADADAEHHRATDSETVNHPAHYGGDTIYETIKVLEAWLTPEQFIGFCRGNTIKYQSRAGRKDSNYAEDLAKAEWYSAYERDYRERSLKGLVGEARVKEWFNP
jgi:hypothetical protein